MTNEFNLSEKIHAGSMLAEHHEYFWKEDVREFIKLLKEKIDSAELDYYQDTTDSPFKMTKQIRIEIDKLAGEKLI
jgi:hypothetical protein